MRPAATAMCSCGVMDTQIPPDKKDFVNTQDQCRVTKSGDMMTSDLAMDGALVPGLSTASPPEVYIGDEAVSWAQAQEVVFDGASKCSDFMCCKKWGPDLTIDGALVSGLPMVYPPEAYAGDAVVSWTQTQ